MEEQTCDPWLAELAKRLRDAFRQAKQKRDGRPYKPNKRFDDKKCWLRTAKLVQRLNASPEDFIEAQFKLARSTVFANTLHGPVAEKRYKQFVALQTGVAHCKASSIDTTTATPPGVAELMSKFAAVMDALQVNVNTSNVLHPDAKAFILQRPWMFDALCIMLLGGQDPDYRRMFLDTARQQLDEAPYLLKAVERMNLDLSIIFPDNAPRH